MKSAILEHGYRHIDTAKDYENEEMVGEALAECIEAGVPRADLFITTKIWNDDYHDVEGACREALRKLRLDYLDMYMIHWMMLPIDYSGDEWRVTSPPFHVVWKNMEALVKQGLVKSIAVSNCTVPMLVDLLAGCEIKPVIN